MINEETYSDGTLRPVGPDGSTPVAVKKDKGGRRKGWRKPKPEAETKPEVPEQEKSLREFAAEVLNDPAYRQSVKDRAKTGKLTQSETRWLIEAGAQPQEKKKENWQGLIAVATEAERVMLADLLRRAVAMKVIEPVKVPRVRGKKAQEASVTAGELRGTTQALTSQVLSDSDRVREALAGDARKVSP